MKTLNFKKLTVSALTIAMGAGLAGAISGTFAWYQYSTRSTVAVAGTSISTTKNLKVSINSTETANYKQDLRLADTSNALSKTTDEAATEAKVTKNEFSTGSLRPVTTLGNVAKDAALTLSGSSKNAFGGNPSSYVPGLATYTVAKNTDFMQFVLRFKNEVKVNNAATPTLEDVDVYLENIVIREDDNNPDGKEDLTKAVRVHLAANDGTANNYALIASEATSTDTNGKLDLDGDGKLDATNYRYEWDSYDETKQIVYGDGVQSSYSIAADSASLYATRTDSQTISGGFKVGAGQTLTVTIWLEGWEKFGASGSESAIWDPAKFAGAKFDVGFSFICAEVEA